MWQAFFQQEPSSQPSLATVQSPLLCTESIPAPSGTVDTGAERLERLQEEAAAGSAKVIELSAAARAEMGSLSAKLEVQDCDGATEALEALRAGALREVQSGSAALRLVADPETSKSPTEILTELHGPELVAAMGAEERANATMDLIAERALRREELAFLAVEGLVQVRGPMTQVLGLKEDAQGYRSGLEAQAGAARQRRREAEAAVAALASSAAEQERLLAACRSQRTLLGHLLQVCWLAWRLGRWLAVQLAQGGLVGCARASQFVGAVVGWLARGLSWLARGLLRASTLAASLAGWLDGRRLALEAAMGEIRASDSLRQRWLLGLQNRRKKLGIKQAKREAEVAKQAWEKAGSACGRWLSQATQEADAVEVERALATKIASERAARVIAAASMNVAVGTALTECVLRDRGAELMGLQRERDDAEKQVAQLTVQVKGACPNLREKRKRLGLQKDKLSQCHARLLICQQKVDLFQRANDSAKHLSKALQDLQTWPLTAKQQEIAMKLSDEAYFEATCTSVGECSEEQQ